MDVRIGFWFLIFLLLVIVVIAPALLMRVSMTPYFYAQVSDVPTSTVALVLGASIVRGEPSPLLAARADTAKDLLDAGKVQSLILSGAVEPNYDEVRAMRQYLARAGVPASAIILDEAGFDTFKSVYRAKEVFHSSAPVIVTQDFHLPRAVFIARALHMPAYGVAVPHGGRLYDYLREIPAAWKALWEVFTHRNFAHPEDALPSRANSDRLALK